MNTLSLNMKPILLLMFSVLVSAPSVFGQEWSKEKEKDGIVIFNRRMDDSKLKEYKGTVKVKTTVDKAVAMFTDVSRHEKFIYKCKAGSVEVLKKETASSFYTYMVIETPWPAASRDVITHYKVNRPDKSGAVLIEVAGAADFIPEKKGIVRVPKMRGYWKISPAGTGIVEITHQAYSSPGGNVPEAMANSASVDAPFSMLMSLRALLER
jgi:hypothetical protein